MVHGLPPPRHIAEIEATGDWAADNNTGRERAGELIAYARESGNPMPLCKAISDIVRSGRYGAIEIGFIYKVAISTM